MKEEKLAYLKNLNLLLVEDDNEILNNMNTILSIFFKKVYCCIDGEEAYKVLLESKVDMIITDYVMPKLDGHKLCKKIRESNKDIPIAIMSNYSDKEKLLKVIPFSLANYLIKPVNYETLTQTLVEMVDRLENSNYEKYYFDASLLYDKTRKVLIKDKKPINISKSEALIIELFINKKNQIISNNDIELELSPNENKTEQAIKSLIYRLRKKLGKNTIINISGFGYMYKSIEEGIHCKN